MNRWQVLLFCAVVFCPLVAWPDDGAWGDLRGRFVYGGDPPPAKVYEIDKDVEAFGNTIISERLMVNAENRGIANVVLYLLPNKEEKLHVHPAYEATANATVQLALRGGRIVPHVLLVRTTQTIHQTDQDKVGHNVSIGVLRNSAPGQLLPTNGDQFLRFSKEEPFPVAAGCNIHPWMRGYVLLRSNPYMSKTDGDGRFDIKNLPVGQHVFRVWHELTGYLRNVPIGSVSTDSEGRLTVAIREGENELPETSLSPKLFASD